MSIMTAQPAQPAPKKTNRHVPLVIRIVSFKKNTGYIQNMFQCLKIKKLQQFFSTFPSLYLCLAGWGPDMYGQFHNLRLH